MPDGSARPDYRRADPDWPLLMNAAMAARFLDVKNKEFKLLLMTGIVPPGRELQPGVMRWHRDELARCMARLFNLHRDREQQADAAEAQQDLRRRIATFDPSAARRPEARRRG